MNALATAINLAIKAHKGQVDKAGRMYVLHSLSVMAKVMENEALSDDAAVAAVLHDVVEDTTVTLADLRKTGFSDRAVELVDLLSRRIQETHAEYLVRLGVDWEARSIKLLDMKDNLRRLKFLFSEKERKGLLNRYRKGIDYLEGLSG